MNINLQMVHHALDLLLTVNSHTTSLHVKMLLRHLGVHAVQHDVSKLIDEVYVSNDVYVRKLDGNHFIYSYIGQTSSDTTDSKLVQIVDSISYTKRNGIEVKGFNLSQLKSIPVSLNTTNSNNISSVIGVYKFIYSQLKSHSTYWFDSINGYVFNGGFSRDEVRQAIHSHSKCGFHNTRVRRCYLHNLSLVVEAVVKQLLLTYSSIPFDLDASIDVYIELIDNRKEFYTILGLDPTSDLVYDGNQTLYSIINCISAD